MFTSAIHKSLTVLTAALLISLAWAVTSPGAIKAVTYFGDQWPVNFLNSEHASAENDFSAIRKDGFNTVIYCVPWSEIQPGLSSSAFNETALSKLDSMISRAEDAGLKVMLRLGYTWDYSSAPEASSRFSAIFYDDSVQNAWVRYAARIYSLSSLHPGFAGAFITWEDFWGGLDGNDASAYRRFDERLLRLLSRTQTVFPGISLECRLDRDPYYSGNTLRSYDHSQTFSCADAPYSCAMLSVSMGWEDGTVLDPAAAALRSADNIRRLSSAAGKPVFIDQFLYMESTPGYENLAKLPTSSVNLYLAAMGDVFSAGTIGYGLWTYRDYADSIVYNPEFGLMDKGWNLAGGAQITGEDNDRKVTLPEGASISQNLEGRGFASSGDTTVSFLAAAETETQLSINVGGTVRSVTVHPGSSVYTVGMGQQVASYLTVSSAGNAVLDNIKVYSHITNGGVYDINNTPGPYLAGVRALNSR